MARPINDSPYLYGLHDPGGEHIMSDAGILGWILFTEGIGTEPNDTSGKDFSPWSDRGFGILVRINNGYAPGGTIPPSSRYADFAKRCGNYVRSSKGAHIWIIGNEMNHPIERPGVRLDGDRLVNPGEAITPSMYANCYRQCRTAIKSVSGHQNDQVIVGAAAPWNPSTVYDGNPNGDWCKYQTDILTILGASNCDGIAVHAYTHGSNPEFIYNDYKMANAPFQNRQYHFRVYRDFMQAIPASMRSLPVYLTETDQDDAWVDTNNGWVQRAYGEIDAWNKTSGTQKIRAVILYRWPKLDKWYIEGRSGVIEDFRQSMKHKYTWEKYITDVPQPEEPEPEPTPTPDTSAIKFPETGKTAKGAFAAFYRKYGVDLTGFPITDEYAHTASGLKTQDWQRLVLEEYPANSGKVRLRLIGAEAADLRKQVATLQQQVTRLQQQIAILQAGGGGGPLLPDITDITSSLPRKPEGFFDRPAKDIKYIVINHTAVRPEVGADRVAEAHAKKWPGIIAQFFVTGDGQIQQTNPIDKVVADNQAWIYNGISVYVAGNFDATVPNDAQLSALAQLGAWLMTTYKLPLDAIKGAQELIVTGSPGKQWMAEQNWKTMLLDRVNVALVGSGSTPSDGSEAAALRAQVAALQAQVSGLQTQVQELSGRIFTLQERNAALEAQIELLQSTGGGSSKLTQPPVTDISKQLPSTAGGLKARPLTQIKYLVFNHTAVDPSVGVDKIAAAHQKRWGAILYQYFIAADGAILQTNALDQVVDLTQPWVSEGVNIALAGNFTSEIPTVAQLDSAAKLSAWLLQEHQLSSDAVKGVSEFVPTQSPGTQWLEDKKYKSLLLARVAELQKNAGSGSTPADDATVQALRAQVSQLQKSLSQAQASVTALTTERDQLRQQLNQVPDVAQLNQQIQTLTKQLQTANADKTTLSQQVSTLTSEKTALNKQVSTLTSEKAALNQQVATLNASKTSLTQQVSTLTGEKTALSQQVTTLTSEKTTLAGQVKSLTADKTSLTGQITTLNKTVADLRSQLAACESGAGTGSGVVPVPSIKDITDDLPTHTVNRYATRALSKITHITIHHSAAPANVAIETIARYHVNTNNWPGIGYHFCIEADGAILQVNKLETISYHAGVVNDYTVGICVEGDFRKGAIPTPLQIQSAGHLTAWLSQKLDIPIENIMGHKEYPQNPTECPGDDWNVGQKWKDMVHQRARAVLAGNLSVPTKVIGHYVLFWQRAESWAKEDYGAAANYVARFRPTLGFTPEDASNAEYVTIVGGTAGVPYETEQMLQNAGCRVERLAGKDFADTKRMLDELATKGQRFQTFTI